MKSIVKSLLGETDEAGEADMNDAPAAGDAGEELSPREVEQILFDCLTSDAADEFPRVATFEDEGIMTHNSGLVLYARDGSTWQLTIAQGRSR